MVDQAVETLEKLLGEGPESEDLAKKAANLAQLTTMFREIDDAALDELEQAVLEGLVSPLIEPPVSTTAEKMRATLVMEHLLSSLRGQPSSSVSDGEEAAAGGYDFSEAFMDDPDALWSMQELVPYNEDPPTEPAELELQQCAQRCILLAGGEQDNLEVVWSAEQRVPLSEGEMVLWQLVETRQLTVDFSVSFVPAPEPASIYETPEEVR